MNESRALKPVWVFEFSFSFLCIAIGILLNFMELNLEMEFKTSSLIIIIIAAILVGPGGVALFHITKSYDLKVYAIMLVSGVNICGLVALPLLGWNWFYFLFFLVAIILFFMIKPKQTAHAEKA